MNNHHYESAPDHSELAPFLFNTISIFYLSDSPPSESAPFWITTILNHYHSESLPFWIISWELINLPVWSAGIAIYVCITSLPCRNSQLQNQILLHYTSNRWSRQYTIIHDDSRQYTIILDISRQYTTIIQIPRTISNVYCVMVPVHILT